MTTATEVKPETVETAEGPAKGDIKGSAWLTEYVNAEAGTKYTSAQVRILLRKLVRDGKLSRDIGADRSRYDFTGPEDPTVVTVLDAVKNGAVEKAKRENIGEAKAAKATGTAKAGRKPRARKATAEEAEPVEVIDESELDDLDADDIEDL